MISFAGLFRSFMKNTPVNMIKKEIYKMMLTEQQVKTLGVVRVVKFQNVGQRVCSEPADLVLFTSRSTLKMSTLFKHLDYFLKRTRKYIKHFEHRTFCRSNACARHIKTIRELWKLMNIDENTKTPVSRIRFTSLIPKKADETITTNPMLNEMNALQNLDPLVIKNYQKLKRNEKKRSDWMQQVSAWRQSNYHHPDYHINHPEEQKFKQLQSEINKKIQNLKVIHEQYMKNIKKLQ